NCPALGVRNEDRHTIGSLYGKGHTSKPCHSRVGRNRLARCRCVVDIENEIRMNLLQLNDRPACGSDCCEKSHSIDLDHWVWRVRRTERKIIAFSAPRRKPMHKTGYPAQHFGMKEGDLVLTFYL